jgi:hypothetical protein
MILVIIPGNIDISVASAVAFTLVMMAVIYNGGIPMPLAMFCALLIGTACGGINGLLLIRFREIPGDNNNTFHHDYLPGCCLCYSEKSGLRRLSFVVLSFRLGLYGVLPVYTDSVCYRGGNFRHGPA